MLQKLSCSGDGRLNGMGSSACACSQGAYLCILLASPPMLWQILPLEGKDGKEPFGRGC